jgi:hypothetical protein
MYCCVGLGPMKKSGCIFVVSLAFGGCSTMQPLQPNAETASASASASASVEAGAGASGIGLTPTYRWHGAIMRAGLRSDKQCPTYCYNQHTNILKHGSEEIRLSMVQECMVICKGLRNDYAGSPAFPAWRTVRKVKRS